MFGHRYFGANYYGPRYFGPAVSTPTPTPTPTSTTGGGGVWRRPDPSDRAYDYDDVQRDILRALGRLEDAETPKAIEKEAKNLEAVVAKKASSVKEAQALLAQLAALSKRGIEASQYIASVGAAIEAFQLEYEARLRQDDYEAFLILAELS